MHVGPFFEASAFHPSLGNEVANGKIHLDEWHLHFQSDTVALDIPLPRLKVRLSDDDDRIYFHDSADAGWKVFTTDTTILDHPTLALHAGNARRKLEDAATRHELWRRLRIVGYVLAVCALLVWLAQIAFGLMARAVIARVPPSVEQKLGNESLKELQKEMPLVDDTNRVAKLAALAAPLTQQVGDGKTQFKFYIVDEPDPNAFALPGGHVIVTTGLLALMDRPEELLAVISHEVAHVTQRHALRETVSAAGPFLLFQVFLGGGVMAGTSDLMIRQGYSQEYELEADDVGWQTLVAANIDPRGMTESFRKLQAWEAHQSNVLSMPQAFSSHPALEKRIARLETKWRKLKRKDGFLELKADLTAEPPKAAR